MDQKQQDWLDAALIQAVRGNDTEHTKRLIAAGANVNAAGKGGWTALHYAALHEYTDIIKLLIQAGADVNARDCEDSTPLMNAAWYGRFDTINILIEAGADISLIDQPGETFMEILKCRYPRFHSMHAEELKDLAVKAGRIKAEDAAAGSDGPSETDFEFDV